VASPNLSSGEALGIPCSGRFGAPPAAHLLDANDCYAASACLVGAYSVRPFVADSRLTQCNVVVQFSESAQKTANGKNRPFMVSRDRITERPLRSKCGHSAAAI